MDEEEEKRRKIQKATHDNDDGCQRDHIPLDVTLEILSRLPAKSIGRSLCVSKLWSSFTTIPGFISSFATRCSARPPRLLATFSKDSKRFVFSFPQNQNHDSHVYSYQMTNTDSWSWKHSKSVQGLVLLKGSVIWNPTMRRFSTLPRPTTTNTGMTYLGYDPLDDKHKVLCVSDQDSEQPRVLTLGAQESWRIISKTFPNHMPSRIGLCVNGILYYRAFLDERVIMCFDVRTEKLDNIEFPMECSIFKDYDIINYEGRLAVAETYDYFPFIELWVLKDGDRHKWMHKHFVLPLSKIDPIWINNLLFKGVSDAGELIFTQWNISKSFYILYFDLRRNSIREALFEGIVGDDFRCRYGLDNDGIYDIDLFPNHIESLVSL